jgi:hypothetical protein
MPNRRRLLLGAAAAAVSATAASAHTPYGQWVVYRKKHLLIGAHRGDARTYDLARQLAAVLEDELPAARARVARGPRPQRIASLLGTGQILVAVLSKAEADRMAQALPPFEDYDPTPLRVLADLGGDYFLFASPELPDDHAWLVVQALEHGRAAAAPADLRLALHPGAAEYWNGRPRPE